MRTPVIRHFDAKGKYCPRKMMDTPDLWEDFKSQIKGEAPFVPSPSNTEEQMPSKAWKGTITTKRDPLLIRETPGGRKISSIPKGASVEILEQGTQWHRVKYGSYTGYSAAKYITIDRKPPSIYIGKVSIIFRGQYFPFASKWRITRLAGIPVSFIRHFTNSRTFKYLCALLCRR